MLFSERFGHKPVKSVIQMESVDLPLKNGLWNVMTEHFWPDLYAQTVPVMRPNVHHLVKSVWRDFFKTPIDTMPIDLFKAIQSLRMFYFDENTKWYTYYDLIEFVSKLVKNSPSIYKYNQSLIFNTVCNAILEREVSGFRFIDGIIAPISSEIEIVAIEEAIIHSNPFHGVSTHLKQALNLLSDKQNPDYRNSIKESISAVESLVKVAAKDSSGGLKDALKTLEKNGFSLHPSLREAFLKLYGYTSDASGIRHAIFHDAPNVTFEDAKYMIVTCSSFCNYIIAKTANQ